uniref:CHAT domain-containing protein n=1 Tax=Methylobacterium sp. TaxID=409 RepID=UPI0020C8A09A|nr:CHAT domain-containing protein [Methylobacterium sp.]USU34585.1 CHAT domain-containing protein [Methylobacterium sp.]
MRTITLELLRHGPSHNQLLSPLTPYLALCENHAATTVHMPFEHDQMLYRLRALGYGVAPESRAFQLKDTARVLANLLGLIPGLTAELGRAAGPSDGALVHVRLVVSASELALLPYELALAPDGFPGAGQSLLLQPQAPLCLTRETRRVSETAAERSRDPCILFAAAAPSEVGTVPTEAHLLALRRAIDPWVNHLGRDGSADDEAGRRVAVERHLQFLPAVSARSLREACATGRFTHVHILAHGVATGPDNAQRYGLALHGDNGGVDVVDGERLATIICAADPDGRPGLARPQVVTLAACDSGNVGSIAGVGASIAHALHDAGVPIVVASQFAFSFEGSVGLAETLYDAFLWGRDPRGAVHELRRRLHAEVPFHHDWAGLVVYASFPKEFASDLANTRIERAFAAVGTALDTADRLIDGLSVSDRSRRAGTAARDGKPDIDWAMARVAAAQGHLRDLLEVDELERHRPRILGLLASVKKRQAEIVFASSELGKASDEVLGLMTEARDLYWMSFEGDRNSHWGIVQYISLAWILLRCGIGPEPTFTASSLPDLWKLAHGLSEIDCRQPDGKSRAWALANLLELDLLAMLQATTTDPQPSPSTEETCRHFLRAAGTNSIEVYATRRQMRRYTDWYAKLAPGIISSEAGAFVQRLQDWLAPIEKRSPLVAADR